MQFQIRRYSPDYKGCIVFSCFRITLRFGCAAELSLHLGSVVTNGGYSDWATTVIEASVKSMWYRFSRREDDYCIECSADGINFKQMRICHMQKGDGKIQFGIYACSPEESSFKAIFTDMQMMECRWEAHDGQQPDTD